MADENNSTEQNNSADQNANIITLSEQEQQILAQARAAYDEAIAQGQSIDQALNEASDILNQSDLDAALKTTTLNLWRGTGDLNAEQSNLDNILTDTTSEVDDVEPTVETVPTGVLTNTNNTRSVSADTTTSSPDVSAANAVTEVNRVEITGMSTVGRNPAATQVSRPEQTELVEEIPVTVSANNTPNETQAVTPDVTPPIVRFMAAMDDVGSVTGSLTSGDTTDDTRLVLSGSVEAGSTVVIFNGTSVIGTATVTGTTWTYTATIEDGVTYQFNAVATDAAGNNSLPTDNFTVIGDMSISQPVIDLSENSDTGDSDSDNLTNDTTVTFTLVNVDDDVTSVEVFNGEASLGFAQQIDGVWTFAAAEGQLSEGANALTVKVTDAAGNTSTSEGLTVTLDTSLAQPVIDLNSNSDTGDSDTDNLTNDTTATFTLTNIDSDASTVEVFRGETSLGFAEQVGGVWTFTTAETDLSEGDNTLTVSVTDAAGNTSTSESLTVTLDTSLAQPVIDLNSNSDTGDSDTDNLTNDTTATFTLTNVDSDASTVEVFRGETSLGNAVFVNNAWTFTATAGQLVEGENTLTVQVTDAAGNTSTSGELTVTLDTSVSQPTIDLNSTSDTGDSNSDNLTNDTTATFTLSNIDSDASTVEVFRGETSLGNAVFANNAWTFTTTAGQLAEGENTLTVQVTDAAGNTSTSEGLTVTLDTSVSQPTIDLNSTSDTGDSNSDNLTNDTTATFTLSNIDSDASTVEVFRGEKLLGNAVFANNAWTFTTTAGQLAEGENTLTVQVTDAAGNASTSEGLTVTLDTSLTQPVINLNSNSDTGESDTDNLTNNAEATFTITNVDADVKSVEVFNGEDSLGFAEQIDGVWTFTAAEDQLSEGANALTVKVTDAAGNTSTSESLTVTLDTGLTQPVIDLNSASDTGESDTDNLTNDATATFTLTNVDTDVKSVKVFNGENSLGFAEQIDGVWTFTAGEGQLSEGANALTLNVTDAAGNSSTSGELTVTLDTTAPTNKVESLTFSNDTGSSTTDLITNVESQTVTGTLTNALADGESLWIWQNETYGWIDASFAVDGKAVDLGRLFLELGTHTVKAQVRDAAGNLGEVQEWEYTLDTSVSKPSIDLNSTSDTGDSDTDNLTNDTTATFTLTNVDTDVKSVEVFNGENSLGFAKQIDGVWTFTAGEDQLSEGANALTVKVTDTAGNTSVSDSLAVTLDTTVDAESDFAVSVYFIHRVSNAGEAAHVRLTLKGVDEDAVSVVVTFSDSDSNTDDVVVNATKDDAGNWVVADSDIRSLTDGEITVTATLTDAAGNTKEATDTLTMDTIAPETTVGSLALSSFVDTDDGFLTNVTQQTITATLSNKLLDGETLLGSVDGGKTWTDITRFITDDRNVSWTTDLDNGSNSIQLRVRDNAGNRGEIAEEAYTLDTEKPVTPTFKLANDTGISDSDGITNDATVTVTLDDDVASWEYSVDGGSTWNTGTGSNFELDADATYEIGDIQVKQTDKAGNTSTASSNSTAITVDTTALAAPSFALATDTGTSDSDGITNDATVNVTLADEAVSWEYSLDEGTTWNTGTGSSFELSADTFYSIDTIKVRQTDTAGNTSTASNSTAITVDTTTLAAPSFALASDTGIDNTDSITNDATVNVTLADDAANWEYSLDGGNTWLTGSGSSFELGANATYAAEQIQVRQTDAAGNPSDVRSNDSAITVDTTAPTVAAENAVTWSEDGKSVILKFSEAVDMSTLTIDKFTLAAGKSFGDGATVSASDDDNDGFADTFTISLGTGEDATAASGDKISIDKSNVIDVAGNTAGEDVTMVDVVSPTVVVFNLTTGKSSSVDGSRVFEEGVSYTIYIVVDSDTSNVSLDDGYSWTGGANLGDDDEIVLVGDDDVGVLNFSGSVVDATGANSQYLYLSADYAVGLRIYGSGELQRLAVHDYKYTDLWSGNWASNPNGDEGNFSDRYKNTLPTSVANAVTWATPS